VSKRRTPKPKTAAKLRERGFLPPDESAEALRGLADAIGRRKEWSSLRIKVSFEAAPTDHDVIGAMRRMQAMFNDEELLSLGSSKQEEPDARK